MTTLAEVVLGGLCWFLLLRAHLQAADGLRRALDASDPRDGVPDIRKAYRRLP